MFGTVFPRLNMLNSAELHEHREQLKCVSWVIHMMPWFQMEASHLQRCVTVLLDALFTVFPSLPAFCFPIAWPVGSYFCVCLAFSFLNAVLCTDIDLNFILLTPQLFPNVSKSFWILLLPYKYFRVLVPPPRCLHPWILQLCYLFCHYSEEHNFSVRISL